MMALALLGGRWSLALSGDSGEAPPCLVWMSSPRATSRLCPTPLHLGPVVRRKRWCLRCARDCCAGQRFVHMRWRRKYTVHPRPPTTSHQRRMRSWPTSHTDDLESSLAMCEWRLHVTIQYVQLPAVVQVWNLDSSVGSHLSQLAPSITLPGLPRQGLCMPDV